MKDIAKDLGVSVVTISKVLRNHPDVGDETRERVLARVKELDYRPNLAARSLVTGLSLIHIFIRVLIRRQYTEGPKTLGAGLPQLQLTSLTLPIILYELLSPNQSSLPLLTSTTLTKRQRFGKRT